MTPSTTWIDGSVPSRSDPWFARSKPHCVVACLAMLLSSATGHAQSYPDKPVRLVIPFAPGGAADIIARTYGQKFSEKFGQGWVVHNRGGALRTSRPSPSRACPGSTCWSRRRQSPQHCFN